MRHVERITVNNARRFGENVEIDFGAGATIILAPNGTGKTTIFEVVEYVLTGHIKRLEKSLDTIIRDGLSEMSARLDFANRKYCQAIYRRDGNSERSGNYRDLFTVEDELSVPYLFRLTHFLEQRSNEWFIDKNDRDAGDYLSQLPIGKELQIVQSKRQGLLTAVRRTEVMASEKLSGAKKELSEFEGLINRRDALTTEVKLTPLKEIIEETLSISKLIDYEEYKGESNLTQINLYFEKTKVSLKQKREKVDDLNIKLNVLRKRIDLYFSNLKAINDKQSYIDKNKQIILKLSTDIEKVKGNLEIKKKAFDDLQSEIKKLSSFKSKFEENDRLQIQLKELEVIRKKNEEDLNKLKESLEETSKYLKNNERIIDQHRLYEKSINDNKNLLNKIERKKDLQMKWQTFSNINKKIIENNIPNLENLKNNYQKAKQNIDKNVLAAENKYLNKKNNLESLNNASGAIQEAVSIIRKNLDENQKNCPVCQAIYKPEDLAKRIEDSLNRLNPAIPRAIEEEKKSLFVLQKAKEEQGKIDQMIQDVTSKLRLENNMLEANRKDIFENIQPQFPGLMTPEDAHLFIEDQVLEITSIIKDLKDKKNQLEPHDDIDKIDNAKLKKSEEERAISDLVNKIKQLKIDIGEVNLKIINIDESLGDEQRDIVLNTLSTKLSTEKETQKNIDDLETILQKKQTKLKEYDDICLNESEAISKMKSIQEGVIAEWKQAGLEGLPNLEILESKRNALIIDIEELENASNSSNTIEQKIANWGAAERYKEINEEVKRLIGNNSEDKHLEILKAKVSKSNFDLQNINEKRDALNLFFDNIRLEYDKVHQELDEVNEPWKGLLKRIVINPLIANAPLLSNKISRNRLTTKTSGVIHNKNTDIADIASEAQLADLQLTLMLTMANRYQWTPWRALLLDDPAQHHDLVHASSLFDVLRDYIVEFDYQVMMSTHDSVQARFFQRKLENEGIDSKIYQLVNRSGGVTAERLI
ncbi:AAA family ATPase [Sedimentibacter sp.]|uniref:AAA family ATPase n=1 Tax=Sedimentibacter sp. TaxID=1960295 RepID=UPI0028AF54E0|nr:AAA family ATPase [Sedimentibacter sp.]